MTILWADDEIELLKPHIMFLNSKGYDIATTRSGNDAVNMVAERNYDLIILDEHMPGITGLEALERIKRIKPQIPVIMITKSEEEDIMDRAVGSKIADYLIKPVNPRQILLSIKKNLHGDELTSENLTERYRREFPQLTQAITSAATLDDWKDLYRRLVYWDIELTDARDSSIEEMLQSQITEADYSFSRFVKQNYHHWIDPDRNDRPLMSHDIFRSSILPALDRGEKISLILIDNFRLDQWTAVRPMLAEFFTITDDSLYCSILPTATQYARNAIFSGLMPDQISKLFPDLWIDELSDEGKNLSEAPLIASFFDRYRRKYRFSYTKINDSASAEKLERDFNSLKDNDLNVIVINVIDMLSHARTESRMIRELASTNAAYRSITQSWFRHSSVLGLFRRISQAGTKVILTTDHGTIRVDTPVKVIGDRNTNTSLRYKVGTTLEYNPRQVYEIKRPAQFGLPAPNVSSAYIFATARQFFAYPNNYNYYVQYYNGTFQHGGISLEEMLVPIVTLTPKH